MLIGNGPKYHFVTGGDPVVRVSSRLLPVGSPSGITAVRLPGAINVPVSDTLGIALTRCLRAVTHMSSVRE